MRKVEKFNDRLVMALKIRGMKAIELSERSGIDKGAISNYINGKYMPKQVNTHLIADALGVSEAWLMGYDVPLERPTGEMYQKVGLGYIRVPLFTPLCCGSGGFADDNVLDYIPVPNKGLSDHGEYFAQVATGDSMKDAGISTGDLLVFEKCSSPSPGMIGCFCLDENETVCKKFTTQKGLVVLKAMNSEFDDIIIDPATDYFVCVGKLKKVIKTYDQ